ncbi:probable plastid-lipid-associated protein 13, chloroplastic [Manihot esculenta]|uniref:Plastid lipid-associated protein/fibrillin conserved domain-containing protein n=1 Tax=Manihot esculenta TaxID=3983 RepID=A0A2C9VEX0_MANES|nr:probable plastid-lipid-associated protein 13, chloroplastic [Manihot esculenta]OAY43124.1 hypothetical protein MANES_08G044700v8 [Manihot esculenta]
MATLHFSLSANSAINSHFSSLCFISTHATAPIVSFPRPSEHRRRIRKMVCTATNEQAVLGSSPTFHQDMERISAKESLLSAFKEFGSFEGLVSGKATDLQRIEVNEKIINLERHNPTPKPTTSPYLEGHWNLEWFGSGSPGFCGARFLLEKLPSQLANLSQLDVLIKDAKTRITPRMKLLSSIEIKCVVLSNLSVEGPLRMKEEYVEAILEMPTIAEKDIPEHVKGAVDRAASAVQHVPVHVTEALPNGLKVPLPGFQRLFMISYLDEDILILRDISGEQEVLTRIDSTASSEAEPSGTENEN